eukprot:2223082-Rhodomonas_salina.1
MQDFGFGTCSEGGRESGALHVPAPDSGTKRFKSQYRYQNIHKHHSHPGSMMPNKTVPQGASDDVAVKMEAGVDLATSGSWMSLVAAVSVGATALQISLRPLGGSVGVSNRVNGGFK